MPAVDIYVGNSTQTECMKLVMAELTTDIDGYVFCISVRLGSIPVSLDVSRWKYEADGEVYIPVDVSTYVHTTHVMFKNIRGETKLQQLVPGTLIYTNISTHTLCVDECVTSATMGTYTPGNSYLQWLAISIMAVIIIIIIIFLFFIPMGACCSIPRVRLADVGTQT